MPRKRTRSKTKISAKSAGTQNLSSVLQRLNTKLNPTSPGNCKEQTTPELQEDTSSSSENDELLTALCLKRPRSTQKKRPTNRINSPKPKAPTIQSTSSDSSSEDEGLIKLRPSKLSSEEDTREIVKPPEDQPSSSNSYDDDEDLICDSPDELTQNENSIEPSLSRVQKSTAENFSGKPIPSDNLLAVTISELKNKLEHQKNLIKKLQKDKRDLIKKNLAMQDSIIVAKTNDAKFSSFSGFPTGEKVMQIFTASGTKDGSFARLLLTVLFPEGFRNFSVTGRQSHNPTGKKNSMEIEPSVTSTKRALPAKQKSWIYEMFFERQIVMGNGKMVARANASKYRVNDILRAVFKNERRRKKPSVEKHVIASILNED